MPTIAISGAGSGIGRTFVDHFAADKSNTIHAMDISFQDDIASSKSHATIKCHTVDTSSQSSVDELAKTLNKQPIDLFIHSAAIRGLVPEITEKEDGYPAAAETLESMTAETMIKTLTVNTVGTFLLVRALIPNLKAGKGKCIIMGSRMGSMGANHDGSKYAYRASKAGVNAIVKSFSIDVPEIPFVILHPGRVESRMVPNMREEGAIDADEAIDMMIPLIEGYDKKDSGKFYTREGEEIPW